MEEKVMSFGEHLVELRYRILVSLIVVVGAFIVIFFVLEDHLLDIMKWPLNRVLVKLGKAEEIDRFLQTLRPTEAFLTTMKVAFVGAVVVGVPVWLYQLWMFVAPGLKINERRAIFPALFFGTFLFSIGALMAYVVVIPLITQFFLTYTLQKGLSANWTFAWYVDYELMLMLTFGIAFELPLVITILTLIGIVTPTMLQRHRRYAILIMFIAAALLTPPDVASQLMLAVPLLLLYEVSIVLSKIFYKRRWRQWNFPSDTEGPGDVTDPYDQPDESSDDHVEPMS